MTKDQKIQVLKLRATGYGYKKIAQKLGISPNTVKSFCRRHKTGDDSEHDFSPVFSGEMALCMNCGQQIKQLAGRKRKKFCSGQCRQQYWNTHLDQVHRRAYYIFRCRHCGKEFQVYGDKGRKYCSRACYIEHRKGGDSHD